MSQAPISKAHSIRTNSKQGSFCRGFQSGFLEHLGWVQGHNINQTGSYMMWGCCKGVARTTEEGASRGGVLCLPI